MIFEKLYHDFIHTRPQILASLNMLKEKIRAGEKSMELRTNLNLEDMLSDPHEKVWQDLATWLAQGQRDLQEAQQTVSNRLERMFLRRLSIQEAHFDQDRQQAECIVSFRLFFKTAILSNCITVQSVDTTTTKIRWDGQVAFPRGFEGWILKHLYAFLYKQVIGEDTLEEVIGLTRKDRMPGNEMQKTNV